VKEVMYINNLLKVERFSYSYSEITLKEKNPTDDYKENLCGQERFYHLFEVSVGL
jgi:hypothetical protein